MPVTCPAGHSSVATDYCDECGTPLAGSPEVSAAVPAAMPAAATTMPAATATGVCFECEKRHHEE
jgi:hypothetical protein